jgi:hypothetical protein
LAEKGRKKGEKSDGKKDLDNKHLLEAGKAIYVKAGRARKGTERKLWTISIY